MTSRKAAERGGRRPAEQLVIATEAARQAVNRLRAARGLLMFVQSAGCCGGSVPICFPAGEYLTGPGDLLLGSIVGCPFYMDARQYEALHPGRFVLDVEPGTPEGFSLAAGAGLHFVTRPCAQPRPVGPQAPGGTSAPAKSARAEVDEVGEKKEEEERSCRLPG
ncbi:MAG TPA: DUF779 domain-containing protein [Trebonia sp.]